MENTEWNNYAGEHGNDSSARARQAGPAVQALLVGLLKLHSVYNAVDDRLTQRFVAALLATAAALSAAVFVASLVPLRLAASALLTGAFGASCPLARGGAELSAGWVLYVGVAVLPLAAFPRRAVRPRPRNSLALRARRVGCHQVGASLGGVG
jgi:hypothetical protein